MTSHTLRTSLCVIFGRVAYCHLYLPYVNGKFSYKLINWVATLVICGCVMYADDLVLMSSSLTILLK